MIEELWHWAAWVEQKKVPAILAMLAILAVLAIEKKG